MLGVERLWTGSGMCDLNYIAGPMDLNLDSVYMGFIKGHKEISPDASS
jgi:hypothetical protein